MRRKYNDYDRDKAQRVRFANILETDPPEYPTDREKGFMVMYLNGKWTFVVLEPKGAITQWEAKVNGNLLEQGKPVGMNKVYRELARLNPPARDY